MTSVGAVAELLPLLELTCPPRRQGQHTAKAAPSAEAGTLGGGTASTSREAAEAQSRQVRLPARASPRHERNRGRFRSFYPIWQLPREMGIRRGVGVCT